MKPYFRKMIWLFAWILLATLVSVNGCSQVVDVDVQFSADIQDIFPGSSLAWVNLSYIYTSETEAHQVTDSDSVTWIWHRWQRTDGNAWERVTLDTILHLVPAEHMDELCSGVMLIELEGTFQGVHWSVISPAKVIFNDDESPSCPQLVTPFSIGSFTWNDELFLQESQRVLTLSGSAHIPGMDRRTGIADMNGDGAVNIQDLLLFTSKFGQ